MILTKLAEALEKCLLLRPEVFFSFLIKKAFVIGIEVIQRGLSYYHPSLEKSGTEGKKPKDGFFTLTCLSSGKEDCHMKEPSQFSSTWYSLRL